MGRIQERFAVLRERHERALIPFVTAGDPDLKTTEALIPALAAAGADLIEIGVPFSDPIAEGLTIQRASERALAAGSSLRRTLGMIGGLRERVDLPLVLMGYANPFLAMGDSGFAEAVATAGVDGVICVDMPPEEGAPFRAELERCGVDSILLASPTTVPERLAMLARETRGFLYYVSLTGVTGAREGLADDIEEQVARIRETSNVPVCVGFGVSTPKHSAQLGRFADGVVVGSALVDVIAETSTIDEAVDAASRFVTALKAPLKK
jgi:tryptophan synthase alpha chain